MVNDALVEYFSDANDGGSSLVGDVEERLRLRTRIRCFDWGPLLPGPHAGGVLGTHATWGQPVVAVANDDNQIALVTVESPTTTLGAAEEWSGRVVCDFSVGPEQEAVVEPTTFDEIMQQQRYVSQIAWSPWTTEGETQYSVLVYATNGDVRARTITYRGETIDIENEEVVYPDINPRYAGLMKWSPKVEEGGKVTLAIFTPDNVTVLTISAPNASILTRREHDLDGRWDEISGAIWDHTSATPHLHFSSLQETLKYPTTLSVSPSSLTPAPHPHWRDQLTDTQSLFSAQHELKGNVRVKIWGLAVSPLGDYIATCSTIHPSDAIEYGPPNERRTSIAIYRVSSTPQPHPPIPSLPYSAEGLAFSLRKWVEATPGTAPPLSTISSLANQLCEAHWRPGTLPEVPPFAGEEDIRPVIAALKQSIVLNPNSVKDRITHLTSLICTPDIPTDLPRTLLAYRLAEGMSHLPPSITNATPFSSEIATHHSHVVSLISSLISSSSSPPQPKDSPDTCLFCAAPIPLVSLDEAVCGNGHVFPRCGLSFKAIMKPGVSKWCGVCGRGVMREMEGKKVGLGRVVGGVGDVCFYCGGKYVG